jgi:large subunit ribosomal protein L22
MEVKAVGKYIKVQPRKVRIIADKVRDTSATHTVSLLRYHTSKSARELRKVLMSAMANAQENHGLSPDNLKISGITVDEGPRQKRMRARAMGRGFRILKKTSHITVLVEEGEATVKVKKHGTQPKPRPSFATGKKKGKAKAEAKPVAEETPVDVVEETTVEPIEEVTVPEAVDTTEAPAEEATEPAEASEEKPDGEKGEA